MTRPNPAYNNISGAPREGYVHLWLVVAVAAGEFADDVAYEVFGVAEEHQGLVEVVQRVVEAGGACGHAALDDHCGARARGRCRRRERRRLCWRRRESRRLLPRWRF